MTPINPWEKLCVDEARRINSTGLHDFFWVVSEYGMPGLMLRLPNKPDPMPLLPKLRNLVISFRVMNAGCAFLIVLKDRSQLGIFEALCRDVVAAVETEKDTQKGVTVALRRTMRWQYLLRGGRLGAFSLEEQQGLVGELAFLRELVGAFGAETAIEAWTGPLGSVKDFELIGACIELKTRRAASKASVAISSADQLADVDGCRVFLRVTNVTSAALPEGSNLHDHVLATSELFKETGRAFDLWEQAVYSTGYSPEDDYDDRRWELGASVDYEITTGFPRVTPPLPTGVTNVRYSISLDACSGYELKEDLINVIRQGVSV